MDKNEQKIYEHITEEATSKMDFNQIVNKVDYSQYKKEKKTFQFPKRLTLSLTTFALTACLILVLILLPNDTEKLGNLVYPEYTGFIKDVFESNIGDGPSYDMSGPIPAPPVIDGYFNENMDYTAPGEGNPNNKPGDGNIIDTIYLEIRSFDYIYEVEYKYIGTGLDYVTVYIEKKLAQKIYNENKEVMDAPNAAPLDIVNGSIVDWFYSKEYYDEDKVIWCSYAESNQIYPEIEGFVCVGVYHPQQRVIVREIFSNTQVNIVDNIYTSLYFQNEGKETLTPVVDKVEDSLEWYASNNLIDETNTFFLFSYDYGSKFDCEIDREANTIRLETYAVQNIDELSKNYSTLLKDYHIWSNSVIVKNDNPNEELGRTTYITYNYKELVEILQDLAKYK